MKDLLRQRLIDDEGLRLKVYRCTAGALTIGVGHNLDAKGISQAIAMQMLDEDIEDAIAGAKQLVTNYDELSDPRKVVLCSMVFQMGLDGMKKWKNTLRAIEEKDFKKAAYNMRLSLWYRQTPARAERLIKMMEEG